MFVELDLQVSSPITGCTPSGGRVRPFAVRRCAPPRFLAAPTSSPVGSSVWPRLRTNAMCGIRLRRGECMIPGGVCRLVEFTTVVCGCMDRPVIRHAHCSLGCHVSTLPTMSPGDFSQNRCCFRHALMTCAVPASMASTTSHRCDDPQT